MPWRFQNAPLVKSSIWILKKSSAGIDTSCKPILNYLIWRLVKIRLRVHCEKVPERRRKTDPFGSTWWSYQINDRYVLWYCRWSSASLLRHWSFYLHIGSAFWKFLFHLQRNLSKSDDWTSCLQREILQRVEWNRENWARYLACSRQTLLRSSKVSWRTEILRSKAWRLQQAQNSTWVKNKDNF